MSDLQHKIDTFKETSTTARLDIEDREKCQRMAESLQDLLSEYSGGKVAFATEIGVSRSTVDRWLQAITIPRPSAVRTICRLFGDTNTEGEQIVPPEVRLLTEEKFAPLLKVVVSNSELAQSPDYLEKIATLVKIIQNGEGNFSEEIVCSFLGIN